MDTSTIPGWTRRRFGLGMTSLNAALLGLVGRGEVGARQKEHKNKTCQEICPQRVCCQCRTDLCTYFDEDFVTGSETCADFCVAQTGEPARFILGSLPGTFAAFCDIHNACVQLACPVA